MFYDSKRMAVSQGFDRYTLGHKGLKGTLAVSISFILWPEIEAMLSSLFPFWSVYMGEVSAIVAKGSNAIRSLPGLEQVFEWLDNILVEIKLRLINALSR